MIVRKIKLVVALVYWLYLRLRGRRTPRIILYYHSVLEHEQEQFLRQIQTMAARCHVVPLSDIVEVPADHRSIVSITFDDAFENQLVFAVPVLKKYHMPATIFVPVGNLGKSPKWKMETRNPDKAQRVMTKEQVIMLSEMGIDIGSHTMHHSYLTQLSDESLREEVVESKQQLESLLGRSVLSISYPHGDYNDGVIEQAKLAGYRKGYTIDARGVNSDTNALAIPRYVVHPTDSLFKLKLIISGAYESEHYLRKLRKRLFGVRNGSGV